MNTRKKITRTTIKSFIKKHRGELFINTLSVFDGMVDGVQDVKGGFVPASSPERECDNNLGIAGAWFVGHGGDYFTEYDNGAFKGYRVSNCCGSFILATSDIIKFTEED